MFKHNDLLNSNARSTVDAFKCTHGRNAHGWIDNESTHKMPEIFN